MCKSKKSTDVLQSMKCPNTPKSSRTSQSHQSSSSTSQISSLNYSSTTTGSSFNNKNLSNFSSSSWTSLSNLKNSLPETPQIYDFSEIRSATNNFLAKSFSSSSTSSSWRCRLRNQDVIVFQRKLRRSISSPDLQTKLSLICKSHHSSLIKLRGVSISGNYIYLVYDFVDGANLSNVLKNSRNPSFTVLSSWLSRMQIATDLAHGIDYIHHCTGLNAGFVHSHIKSTSIIVVEPSLNAKICHFGTADLCGEVETSELSMNSSKELTRSERRGMRFEGTRGYMAPELQFTGTATKETDVFALGVVVLELLSGEEALKYRVDEESGAYTRISVIETAREMVAEDSGCDGGLRKWVDRRLKDSFPVDVADKMVRLGLECVEEDPKKRPDMRRVAGCISKLYLDSKNWADRIGVPDISVSLAPR